MSKDGFASYLLWFAAEVGGVGLYAPDDLENEST